MDVLARDRSLGKSWLWLLALGIGLCVLGVVALSSVGVATIATVFTLGLLLFAGGAVEAGVALASRTWRGFGVNLAAGVLMALVGLLLMALPGLGGAILTALIGVLLLAGGVGRALFAVADRGPGWGWSVASGIASVVLGVMIFAGWPLSALWFLGVMVGCELILRGTAWISASVLAHRVEKLQPT